MKKVISLLILTLLVILSGCSNNEDTLKIGVDFYPMPELVDLIKDDLAADGIKVELVRMNYNLLNDPLNNGEIDGNLVQHEHFLNFFNVGKNATLKVAQPIYHSKFAIYSRVYNSAQDIPNGETIYIPQDIVNLSRALLLMEHAGLIKLAAGKTTDATLDDIEENYKDLVIVPNALDVTPLAYRDSGYKLAIMYPSYARAGIGLEDDSDFIVPEVLDDITKTYAISFVTREESLTDPRIVKFIEHMTSNKVRDWINENYGWAAIPAF